MNEAIALILSITNSVGCIVELDCRLRDKCKLLPKRKSFDVQPVSLLRIETDHDLSRSWHAQLESRQGKIEKESWRQRLPELRVEAPPACQLVWKACTSARVGYELRRRGARYLG
jgi:hypothetical protein